ncbi:hypothetical protein GBAR_LOCUS12506, partial [Geodia barretti]
MESVSLRVLYVMDLTTVETTVMRNRTAIVRILLDWQSVSLLDSLSYSAAVVDRFAAVSSSVPGNDTLLKHM